MANCLHIDNNCGVGTSVRNEEGIDMMLNTVRALAAAACFLPIIPGRAADVPADRIEEIVVTAQRREEKLQDVPVSVVAFNETAIRQAGIRNTADFLALTPNVSFDQSFTVGNSFVTMRGVEQINNADSPVAVVVDGVPQGNQKQLKMELYDVERIEVLEGPQGALYGRNAIGGAINIITKQPTNDFSGFAQATSRTSPRSLSPVCRTISAGQPNRAPSRRGSATISDSMRYSPEPNGDGKAERMGGFLARMRTR
jgi:outer membrane receptor protein involved in Fe transport